MRYCLRVRVSDMERYEAYKDSGVEWIGEIPEGWTLMRITGLYDARNEKASDRDYPPLSVTMQGIMPQLETAAKTQDGDNRKLVRKGDFVINSRSDRRGACGISAYDGSVTLISNVLAPKDQSAVSTRYYSYLFRSEGFADEFYRQGTGIVDDLWSTNWTRMKNILVARPPIAEQECIADYLDAKTAEIDALVADCEREVELLQEYRKAVISEAVTKGLDPDAPMKDSGVEWIGEIPAGWYCAKLGLISVSTLGRMLDTEKQTGDCLAPYLSNRDVQWFRIDDSDLKEMDFPFEIRGSYEIHDGDLLVCEGGEVGRSTVWHGPTPAFYFQKAIHRVRFDTSVMDPDFAAYQMFQKAQVTMFREVRKGESTIGHLPGDQLRQLTFAVPPLDEQHDIVANLDAKTAEIDSLIDAKQSMADKLREYRKSLISEAVTGKFKVPGA